MVRFYLRNTLLSPATLVGILGLLLAMLTGARLTGDLAYSYQCTIAMGITDFFIPVAAVLPICLAERQMNAGKIRDVCLVRSGRRAFSFGALLGAVLSGMAVTLGAFALFTASCAVLSPSPCFGRGIEGFLPGPFYAPLYSHPALLYLMMGAVFTMNGSLWPAVSLACWSITDNQYLALAVPFVLNEGMSYFGQFFHLYVLDPGQLLLKGVCNQLPGGGIPYVLTYCAVVILVCGLLWSLSVTRRVRHG